MPNLLRILWHLETSLRRLHWDQKKLRKYQEKKLHSLVNYAYHNVEFYHDKLKEQNIRPTDIRTIEDLNKLPIVKKEELKAETAERLVSKQYDHRQLKMKRTSGSTGKPFQFYINGKEDEWRKAIYMRANISCGQNPRDSWVFVAAPHHFGDTTRIQRKLGIYAQKVVSVFTDVNEQIRLVREGKPDVLDGYSQSLLLLAKEVEDRNIYDIRPRIIFGSADLIDEASGRYLEEVFRAPFYDQYGCSEIDRSAWQCPEKIGYHMDVDSVITQFVDENGEEVAPGESGEIIFTSLFNYSMPFIRYAVGDVGRPIDDICPCGRSLPLMKMVDGRTDSFIVSPDGRILTHYEFIVVMFEFPYFQDIAEYRIIQSKHDSLEFLVRRRDESIDEILFANEILKHFSSNMPLEKFKIEVKIVDHILNRSGKLNSVISHVARGN